MAKIKATKTAPESAPTDATTAGTTPAGEKGTNDRFFRTFVEGKPAPALKADGTAARVAPQLQVIANALEAAGEAGLSRAELVKNLEGVITTRQPIGRIVSYYQKDLSAFGLGTLVKGPLI